jgi:hypothetical protein
MKRFLMIIFILIISITLYTGDVFAQRINSISRLFLSGDIKGIVECPEGTTVSGALVYIPGESFMAKTNTNGEFILYNIPRGLHDLAIEITSNPVFILDNIIVSPRQVNNLGTIIACPALCSDNKDCLMSFYCSKEEGDCTGIGTCRERPDGCFEIWDPVCGCDGMTYSNACFAAAAGVNVDYKGECITACESNLDCEPKSYCAKEPGDCKGSGTCKQRPYGCPDVWEPVCGCDGITYSNECDAAMEGISVNYKGECIIATCTDNSDCMDSSYCAKEPGDCKGSGTCRERPEICPLLYDPVCGCNGNTYPNECVAAGEGVSVDYKGPCDQSNP